jgi:GNAT superfamily N-acetyltransferase
LLNLTVWGTTHIKYRRLDVGEVIYTLSDEGRAEHYYAVAKGDPKRVTGTYFMYPKTVSIDGTKIPAFYGRLFSVDPAFRGKGLGKAILKRLVEMSRSVHTIPRLDYADVEKTNIPSWTAFVGLGSESVTIYHVPTFSRTFPKSDPRVEGLATPEEPKIVSLLEDYYDDHVLMDFQASVIPRYYHVIRDEDGEIVVGAQCMSGHWYLERISGLDGWLALSIFSRVPFPRRQTRRDFHFVRFGDLYVKEGHEADLAALMSHLLDRYQVFIGTIYIDPRSRMYEILRANRFGIVNSLTGETSVEVMVHPTGIDGALRDRIRRGPVHISITDT